MCDATTKCFSYSGEWKVENVIAKVKNRVEGSFYLCNLSDVTRKFYDWNEKMPRVKPFYAVSYDMKNELITNCEIVLIFKEQMKLYLFISFHHMKFL